MFSYIRWFSAISFVLVVMVAIFGGHYFKKIASADLIAVVDDNNASLAQGFINTTWKTYGEQMKTGAQWYSSFRSSGVKADQWKNYKGYQEMVTALDNFSRGVFKHFEGMPISGISIYLPDGTRLISTDADPAHLSSSQGSNVLSQNAPEALHDDEAFNKALANDISSTILEDQPITKPGGAQIKGTLIRTLLPVTKDDFVPIVMDCEGGKTNVNCTDPGKAAGKSQVEAVVEIRYDVTSEWKQLAQLQMVGTFGVIGIFIVIILTLLYTSGKAESIIARQHETNLELAAQAAGAQAESRDKSQFLANVSHELRTPLNAIIGFSEFIKSERSGPIGNPKYGEYIKDIHGSGVHLLSLINDILDYSKAEADKLELEISEVDATKSVKNCMRLVSPRAEVAQVRLIEEIPREHFILKTDAKKLKQVMLNLLSNAVKFTPSGGAVTVTMWQNVVDGSLSVEVKDTGIGIAPKDISRAMAPFGQVDNTLSRKYEGTGLGLPLTRKFIEIMGGSFNIQSEVGRGTLITVTIPKEISGKAARPEEENAA